MSHVHLFAADMLRYASVCLWPCIKLETRHSVSDTCCFQSSATTKKNEWAYSPAQSLLVLHFRHLLGKLIVRLVVCLQLMEEMLLGSVPEKQSRAEHCRVNILATRGV
ncbi:hypothetical protein HBI56_156020 [Parastagonospora nodorum]|uniref:Uncharacterized protein n=1 Tax=Phaeosphaeria nodorum (strain SN15 / ATCC MYA-4574 / FGSC 10173) TaxID=321614 RepID=A0A7U2I8R3_PHANO|nr:hypothetical protein HBH56_118710 [Parastagonospora nodorum]QRD05313.1 hypothetical protein JI435_422260 [Parastagonospora nodorum SN15]KAH3929084.1 hypothetical protein HBH54_130480 [Parastagonospora nodorum]KAH3950404.1 hypothetical protein HBH53_070760 [Parastagonospora nodorum]KAH3959830.1 hypothetical protein HBH51_197120 [Parastagonospora nodorum]